MLWAPREPGPSHRNPEPRRQSQLRPACWVGRQPRGTVEQEQIIRQGGTGKGSFQRERRMKVIGPGPGRGELIVL